jgi:hypothetical protein
MLGRDIPGVRSLAQWQAVVPESVNVPLVGTYCQEYDVGRSVSFNTPNVAL